MTTGTRFYYSHLISKVTRGYVSLFDLLNRDDCLAVMDYRISPSNICVLIMAFGVVEIFLDQYSSPAYRFVCYARLFCVELIGTTFHESY